MTTVNDSKLSHSPLLNSELDIDKARAMFRVLCPESSEFITLVIEGEPYSKARPRFNKRTGTAYNTTKQNNNENYLKWNLKQYVKEPYTGNLAIGCIFFRSTKQRIDVDNMLKNVMDAANKIVYVDDCQVTAKLGIIELDRERPRTVIMIGKHKSSMDRTFITTSKCANCGKEYDIKSPYWNGKSKYCSKECTWIANANGTDLKGEVKCLCCGKQFRRKTSAQKYCSEDCRVKNMNERARGRRKHPDAHCQGCGKKVSRPEYVRCRECWKTSRKKEG